MLKLFFFLVLIYCCGAVGITSFGVMGGRTLTSDVFALSSERTGNAEIFLVDIARQLWIQVTHHPAYDGQPSWSPDGQRLAFTSNREVLYELYTINLFKGKEAKVLSSRLYAIIPTWSPDGQTIAFVSDEGVYEVVVATGEARPLVSGLNDSVLSASWSPTGGHIAYSYEQEGDNYSGNAIFVLDIARGTIRNLTSTYQSSIQSAWSPDGKWLVFNALNPSVANYDLYLMNLSNNTVINLTHSTSLESFPTWSPDSTRLAFISEQNGLYIMDIQSDGSPGVVRRVLDQPILGSGLAWRP